MVNSPSANSRPASREEARQPAACPPDNKLPENSQENLDAKLDHAIEETFPTSDPISVTITKGGASDYTQRESPSAASIHQGQAEQDTAEGLLDQVRETLRDVADTASGTARQAYDQGQRYIRQAGERYPEAERYYRRGRRAVSQRAAENPLLSILLAGAIGYALAWMIHGERRSRKQGVPDYGRTSPRYAARHR